MMASGEVLRAERISYHAMVEAVADTGAQFVRLLGDLESRDGDRPVPHLTWTVAETAVHMLTIVRRGTGDRRRADSLSGLAELNDRCIAELDARDVEDIASALEHELGRLRRGLDGLDADTAAATPFELHAGITANIPSALSYVLFDFLAHGWDIAHATDRVWPIDPAHAALDLHACLPVLAPWVRESVRSGAAERLALGFPGDPDALVVEAGGGTYRAQNEPRDLLGDVVEADPTETFLALAGRATATSAPARLLAAWFEPI